MKQVIIKSGKTLLFITSSRGIAPIGYKWTHGFRLNDHRWCYELEKEYDGVMPARVQRTAKIVTV